MGAECSPAHWIFDRKDDRYFSNIQMKHEMGKNLNAYWLAYTRPKPKLLWFLVMIRIIANQPTTKQKKRGLQRDLAAFNSPFCAGRMKITKQLPIIWPLKNVCVKPICVHIHEIVSFFCCVCLFRLFFHPEVQSCRSAITLTLFWIEAIIWTLKLWFFSVSLFISFLSQQKNSEKKFSTHVYGLLLLPGCSAVEKFVDAEHMKLDLATKKSGRSKLILSLLSNRHWFRDQIQNDMQNQSALTWCWILRDELPVN